MKKLFHVTIDIEEAEALDADHIKDCLLSKLRFSEKWSDSIVVAEIEPDVWDARDEQCHEPGGPETQALAYCADKACRAMDAESAAIG